MQLNTCSICGTTFGTSRSLKSHQRQGSYCRNHLNQQRVDALENRRNAQKERSNKGKERVYEVDENDLESDPMEAMANHTLEPGPSNQSIVLSVEDVATDPENHRPKRKLQLPKRFRDYTHSEFIDEIPPPPPPLIVSNTFIPPSNTGDTQSQVVELATEMNLFGVFNQYMGELPSYNPDESLNIGHLSDSHNFIETHSDHPWWLSTTEKTSTGLDISFYTPFKNMTTYRIMEWLYNGSNVKSNMEIDKLVHEVIQAEDFNPQDLKGFRCSKENERMDDWEDEPGTPFSAKSGWKETSVKIRVPCEKVKQKSEDSAFEYEVSGLFYREPLEVIKTALQSEAFRTFHHTPFKSYWRSTPKSPPERIYSEIYNSDIFMNEYEKIKLKNKADGCTLEPFIASICLWSDSTHLTNFGDAFLWPIYLYFSNQSKYERNKLSTLAAHHIAYIPKLGDNFQDWYTQTFGIAATASVLTHCHQELMHSIFHILFGEVFQEAYKSGLVFSFYDDIVRKMFPRFFIYGMDYPEKVLVSLIRYFGDHPCPRCLILKSNIHLLGTLQDWETRTDKRRIDSKKRQELINQARALLYHKGIAITSSKIDKLLKAQSLVPVRNAFSTLFFDLGFDFHRMIAPDLLHEFELGVWKGIFTHLMRILVAAGGDLIQELNKRYRMIPTFGNGTIQQFRSNPSEMKKLAGRDFEDLLQCALPVFEGLLPPKHDKIVTELIFELQTWHGLAKLQMHTDFTLKALEGSTVRVGRACRKFKDTTCQFYDTRELPPEAAARTRQKARKTPDGTTTTRKTSSKKKELNLNTIKYHSLGDYVTYIRQFGPTDNYSTQTGESEHRRVKRFYTRTQKRQYVKGISKQQQRQRILQSISLKDPRKLQKSLQEQNSTAEALLGSNLLLSMPLNEVLSPGTANEHNQISSDTGFKVNLTDWLHSNAHIDDPALKNFTLKLRRHLLMRIIGPTFYDRSDEENVRNEDLNSLTILDDAIYSHQRMRVNYTTYDLRRDQDSINPRTHPDIMLLSEEIPEDKEKKWHPYWYARVIGIYHARVYFCGLKSHVNIRPGQRSIHFLFVRWFGIDVTHEYGWVMKHLPMLGFSDSSDPDAVGFVNPDHVLRGAHLIPAFHFGRTNSLSLPTVARLPSKEHEDWLCYYANIFVDRDMLMRYRGGGVGHSSTRNATNTFLNEVDSIDYNSRSVANATQEYIAQLQKELGDMDETDEGNSSDSRDEEHSGTLSAGSDNDENIANFDSDEYDGDEYEKLIYQLGYAPL